MNAVNAAILVLLIAGNLLALPVWCWLFGGPFFYGGKLLARTAARLLHREPSRWAAANPTGPMEDDLTTAPACGRDHGHDDKQAPISA